MKQYIWVVTEDNYFVLAETTAEAAIQALTNKNGDHPPYELYWNPNRSKAIMFRSGVYYRVERQ